MKILIFDPLYSSIGHFYRYNKFLLELLSEINFLEEISFWGFDETVLDFANISNKIKVRLISSDENENNIQIKSIKTKGIHNKLKYHFCTFKIYKRIISEINSTESDLVFFPSSGQIPFWLAVRKLKKKYIVSAISIKSLYDKNSIRFPLYIFFKSYLKHSKLNFVTEEYYKLILENNNLSNVCVFPDRYLTTRSSNYFSHPIEKETIKFTTLGTISKGKNPIDFVKEFVHYNNPNIRIEYRIFGKILDETSPQLHKLVDGYNNVQITDSYISKVNYLKFLTESDFIVIPYNNNYTKYATSGVMWDCFENQIPIICPNIEPFKYYLSKYKIGYLYEIGNLSTTLNLIINEKILFRKGLYGNYANLIDMNSKHNLSEKIKDSFIKIS